MSDASRSCPPKVLAPLIGVALFIVPPASADQRAITRQAQVLVELASRIVDCSVQPCLGDNEGDVRRALKGRIVSDGVFEYSDLALAYPETQDVLRGLVEWDFDDGLDSISLKITDFQVAPAALIDQVERTLPGCEMEQESSDRVMERADGNEEDDETQEWSCLAEAEGRDGILVEVYLVPGLILFEVGP